MIRTASPTSTRTTGRTDPGERDGRRCPAGRHHSVSRPLDLEVEPTRALALADGVPIVDLTV